MSAHIQRGCEYAAGAASEKARELIAQGWTLRDGREFHQLSRALGTGWPIATLEMTAPDGEAHSFRFVGHADRQLWLSR